MRLDGVTATVNTEERRAVDVSVSYTLVSTGTAQQLRVTVASDGTGTGAP